MTSCAWATRASWARSSRCGATAARSRSTRRPRASGPGDPVVSTGAPLSVELGPGMLGAVYDGVQRPLDVLEAQAGAFLSRGVDAPGLDREKQWVFHATAHGRRRRGGGRRHRHRAGERGHHAPHHGAANGVKGHIKQIESGTLHRRPALRHAVDSTAARRTICIMMQKWPVRVARPYTPQALRRRAARDRHARHRHVLPAHEGRRRRASPGRSARARPSRSTRSPSGPTPRSSSSSAAASAATR